MRAMFRFADWVDVFLMLLGAMGSLLDGSSPIFLFLLTGNVMNTLGNGRIQQDFMHEIEKYSLYFVYVGLAVLVGAFMEGYCWSRTSERQVLRIRYKFLEAILRQEVGFFDSQEATTAEIINTISKETSLIQEVLSEKVPVFLMNCSAFISAIVSSIYLSRRLSLVAFPLLLLLVVPGLIYAKYLVHLCSKSHEEHAKANALVQQAISSIKTVYSFTAEKSILERYAAILDRSLKFGIKQGIAKGLAVGSTGLTFAIWSFLAWYGSRLVMYHGESGSRIYAVGMSIVFGGLSLGMAIPEVKYFTKASLAAAHILKRIDRIPKISLEDPKGVTLDHICGEVVFESIKFSYPSRPEAVVLEDFNLRIPAGKAVGLVGSSGSGKSTVVALVQRFYDVDKGIIRIDGIDIKKLQLKWIRGKMGIVSQDHVLFGTSIKENILFGKPEATMDEIRAAAMTANAHNFITELPQGYDTKVGERGMLLSGGQKQRIAIARAVIKNPAILLLDEATSALDSESETLVQNALDQASIGRTTLVVAHKLSTIRNADQIAVIHGGRIVEVGSHDDLMSQNGSHYLQLVKSQLSPSSSDQEPESCMPRSITKTIPSVLALTEANLESLAPGTAPTTPQPAPSFSRLLSMNLPEWKQALIGSLSAVAFGSLRPIYAFSIGGLTAAFYLDDHDEMQTIIRRYVLILFSLSVISVLVNLSQHYNFAYMGEHLTRRIRLQVLEKILTFEVAWFDEESHSSGALCSRLGNDAFLVKALIADRISLLVQSASGLLIALLMGLILAWKLALVMIATEPLPIVCHYARRIVLSRVSLELAKAQQDSTQIAVEAVYNHRMVTSFGCARKVLQLFEEAQKEPLRAARKNSWVAGVTMGCASCLAFMWRALHLWYGGKLALSGEATTGDVFKTFLILASTGKVIAEAGSMTSDLAKGATAVASVFEVLDRESQIRRSFHGDRRTGGSKSQRIRGNIEMEEVGFAYPSRPQCFVLRKFSLEVKAGSSMGLVGRSGCGKSTIIGLIQRFYDVNEGFVKIDGMDIRELDIVWYRACTALVSQEPVIFSGSIRDNIAFGKPEGREDEIIEAARAANAHDFISSMKDGYDTECGAQGVQLSGGQRQRIAIARAIIRNPTILLLDEATSALDVRSEGVVQEALDRMMVGRTTVVVAHRLNTIRNSDSIAFVGDGRVLEHGTYAQLMNKRGAFFSLAALQT